jgi:hypothetical protein
MLPFVLITLSKDAFLSAPTAAAYVSDNNSLHVGASLFIPKPVNLGVSLSS